MSLLLDECFITYQGKPCDKDKFFHGDSIRERTVMISSNRGFDFDGSIENPNYVFEDKDNVITSYNAVFFDVIHDGMDTVN